MVNIPGCFLSFQEHVIIRIHCKSRTSKLVFLAAISPAVKHLASFKEVLSAYNHPQNRAGISVYA